LACDLRITNRATVALRHFVGLAAVAPVFKLVEVFQNHVWIRRASSRRPLLGVHGLWIATITLERVCRARKRRLVWSLRGNLDFGSPGQLGPGSTPV
jgi:hypothetical protein